MMRLFGRNKRYEDSLKTITEESVLLVKVGPVTTEDHPLTTQPIIPTPQKGGFWAIRRLLKKWKGSYNVKNLLTTNTEENVVLLRVNPITEDRQPEDTAPPRGGERVDGRGDEEAAPRVQPIPQQESTNDEVIEAQNDPTANEIERTVHGTFPPVPSSMEDKPCKFSKEDFIIHDELGAGSYGKVVLASHPSFQQKLAVKITGPQRFVAFKTSERYILRELRNHPYITHLIGTFHTMTHLFLVMEFASGGDLRELIETSAPFGYDMIRRVTAEIVCGLQFIHSHEIIHRDLKPENIVLDSEGHIRIADFGISRQEISDTKDMAGVAGTDGYMAPEVTNNGSYNISADYYSLGVILYEMAVSPDRFSEIKENQNGSFFTTVRSQLKTCEDIFLFELLAMLFWENYECRTYLVRNIRRHPFFEWTDWAEVEKGESPPAFTPEPTLTEPEYYSMTVEEFMADESHPVYGKDYNIKEVESDSSEELEYSEYYDDSSMISEEDSENQEDPEDSEDSSMISEEDSENQEDPEDSEDSSMISEEDSENPEDPEDSEDSSMISEEDSENQEDPEDSEDSSMIREDASVNQEDLEYSEYSSMIREKPQ